MEKKVSRSTILEVVSSPLQYKYLFVTLLPNEPKMGLGVSCLDDVLAFAGNGWVSVY